MKSIHTRVFPYPLRLVRSWIDLAWSGSQQDIFPRDVIRSWRRNPDGSTQLIRGVTRLGHGPFAFTLRWWDGVRWLADLDNQCGWQGFHLREKHGETSVTHTLQVALPLATRLTVVPIHDWAVEATLDRLAIALATGAVPRETTRPMGYLAKRMLASMRDRQGIGALAMSLR